MHYNCALTVDCVVFSKDGVVLIRRKNPPFRGAYALPGGFVEEDESVEEACIRETLEETGLVIRNLKLAGVYSTPGRDPRGRTVSVAFVAEADLNALQAGDDAAEAEVIKDWEDTDLAFDHKEIIADALKIRGTPVN
ncbi:MAG: NUDIX domain-containing protein [Bacteroidales bacterium]